MLRNRVMYILLLLVCIGVYIFTNTYYTFWILLAVIVLPIISLVFMVLSKDGLIIELKLPVALRKGEDASFDYKLQNKSRFPIARLTFQVNLESQLTFAKATFQGVTGIGSKKEKNLMFHIAEAKVGAVQVITKKVKICDAFGLFALKGKSVAEKTTVVYPLLRDLEIYMQDPVETLGEGNRYSPDKKGFDVSEIFALREYSIGDEVRKIHWKLSSKLDKTIVRDFSLPLNYSVFLLLELTYVDEDIMDKTVEFYASFSKTLLEIGINHNLAWYDGGMESFHVRELNDFEDMDVAFAEMLTSYAYKEETPAIDCFVESPYLNEKSTLVYIATKADEEKLEEIAMNQTIKVIDVSKVGNDLEETWV